MEEIERHFLDRKLGRGVIRVRLTGSGSASIDLEFYVAGKGWLHVKVEASPICVDSLSVTNDNLLYQLSRMAISQVQQLIRANALVSDRLELECAVRPWNGDLTKTSYGGATTGCAAIEEARDVRKMRRIAKLHYRRMKC